MNFREIELSNGKKIFMGKSAGQNEELVKRFIGKNNAILHTEKPGSPFCILENLKPSLKEIKEAAIYCALYSQDWRDNKTDVKVHIFSGKDVYKRTGMKVGTFGVKKFKELKVNKKDIEKCRR
jgi:predicted ribosome quality control (RQC) complex YloA/Tae2 family protein